jgi:hypothetical protein
VVHQPTVTGWRARSFIGVEPMKLATKVLAGRDGLVDAFGNRVQ